jgi:prepilin-type N-terminal cleavage/methylation domain-containing protein
MGKAIQRTRTARWGGARGFTFIELLIAMAIVAIGMMAALSMQFGTSRNNTKGDIYTQANMLAKAQMEALKNQDVDDLAVVFDFSDPNNPLNADGVTGGIFNRSWSIENLGTGARRITVAVRWNRLGQPGEVVLTSNTKGNGV